MVALLGLILSIPSFAAPAVRVTLQLDNNLLKVGDSTTAHVMAQIVPDQTNNTVQIVTWYVDLLDTAKAVIQIDPTTIVVPSSDSDPSTSSKGALDSSGNLRGVYDTLLNTPGAGHDAPIELFSVKIKAATVGSATFSVAAGTTAPALDEDFIVSTLTGDPVFGGLYDTTTNQVSSFNNVPPTIDSIADITVAEGTQMTVTAKGHDADVGQTLRYSLAGVLPAGANLDPVTGVLVWIPTERQGPATYAFKIKVTDNGTPPLSATNAFNIFVTEVNVAPALQVPATINTTELQSINATCTASDSDFLFGKNPATNRLTFSLLSAPPGATINATNGAFAWTPTEAQGPGSYTIKVVVTDDGVPPMAATNTFVINVAEQNLPPTVTAPPAQTIAEGATLNVAFVATDPDLPANNLTFKMVSAPPGVILDTTSGLVTWTPTEAQGPGVYTIRVAVGDNAPTTPLFATNSMQVTVTEVNAAPTLDVLTDRIISELTPLTFTAVAHDADLPAQTLTFSLDSPPAGASIDPASGAFSWTPTEAQGPGRYTIVVRVTDNGSPARADTKSFNVTVNEANSAPTLTTPPGKASQTVAELTAVSIQFTATDSDIPANLISFSLQNAPSGAAIDASSGLFTWTPTEAQGPGTYSIKVLATDNGVPPLSATNTISITVTEQDTPPAIDNIPGQTIDELTKLTVAVVAHDSDLPAQTLTFSLVTPPAGAAIDPTTGVFTWTPTEAQGPGQYTITVKVTESGAGGLSVTKSFNVAVNEVNSAPQFAAPSTLTVQEMVPINARISATDADILSGQTPSTNKLTYSLLDGPAGMTIDAQTGALSWTPTESQGPGSYQVRVSALDDGVPPQSSTATLTVNVTEVNRAPSIAAPAAQTIPELVPFTATFTATDPDIPANTLSFFLVQAPAGVKLDATTGAITWTPSEVQGPGNFAIKVAVSDNGSPALFATNTMNVTVTEVNTKPVLASIPDFVVAAGTTLNFTATATDSDLPAQTLTFSLDSAPQGASINSASGAFTWTPAANLAGQQFTITVRVTESGAAALFDTKSFKISVGSAANTAPHIGSISDQTISAGSKLTVGNVAIDTDVPANTLTFSLATAPTGVAIDPVTGILTWTPTAAQVGKTQIQVKVSDNGVPSLSATNSFFVTVAASTSANTPPTLQVPANQSIAVGSTLNVTITATDVDIPAQTLTFALVSGPTGASINPNTGVLTWTPTSAQTGQNQIQVSVTDNGNPPLSVTNSFNVTVTSGTASAATLRIVSVLDAGTTLEVRGQASATYDIEFSTDLINWSPLTTVSLGAQTLATYLDTVHGFGQQKGFYRAKSGGSAQPSSPTIKPQSLDAGGFTLRVTGDLGTTYRIQFSTDLVDWSPVGTVSLTTSTTADFIDTAQATRGPKGFYRAIFP
jgi:hypothetical protein